MRYHEILVEKITGNIAIGYHRTKNKEIVNQIVTSGFIKGSGDTYGKGVYMTYDLKSQLNTRMIHNYGDYIIRNKVILNDYLIFDKDVAQLVYKKDWEIEKQLKRFGFKKEEILSVTKIGNTFDFTKEKWFAGKIQEQEYTSEYAQRVHQYKNKNIAGMVFTGRTDGKVIVTYNLSTLRPFGVANAWSLDDDLVWEKINAVVLPDQNEIDYNKLHDRISAHRKPYSRLRALAQEQKDYENVLNNYRMIRYVKNPTEKMLLIVIKEDPECLRDEFGEKFCDNFSEEFKIKSVMLNAYAIKIFDYPSETVQLAAVKTNPWVIRYIKNPTEKVLIEALSGDIDTYDEIKYKLTDKAYEFYIFKKLKLIGCKITENNGEWEVYNHWNGKIEFKSDDLSEIQKYYGF